VLSSAVASGIMNAVQAWPELFGGEDAGGAFPSKDADMTGFVLEEATPESFAADIAALAAANKRVVIREEQPPPFPRVPVPEPGHQYVPDTEWT
jgi:hypothetical protein